ncbi:hypothetical protein C0033_08595 [Clostridium sp. chh4-2]|uniref:glycosyltransferase family 2 protein n=1 Tax=Clostridium sp. chh4-2 TaxID=2067550 RepID=UPI000CCF8FC5|nr:glycosyltransferase family A protein [Clostridium sp. chh4-2]PNV62606.1 hypothetical protein C0033_08595 [Clostridium sp. chh4-2]
MREKPVISVIMPIYNAENYVEEAIESILNQTYGDFELIIIDDCPTDSTMKKVNGYKDDRIVVIHNETNLGISHTRNKGLEVCRGKFIALMDDDDIAMPDRFKIQVDFLNRNPDIDVVGGRYQMITEDGILIKPSNMVFYNPLYLKALLLFRNIYANSEVMFRRRLIDEFHLRYVDGLYGIEDFRFWIDCSKIVKMSNIDELFLKIRKHIDNETSRVLKVVPDKRRQKYAELQEYSLSKSGFRLNDNDVLLLTKILEENSGRCNTEAELQRFYEILKKIVYQAKEMQCDNHKEIEIVCSRLFGEKVSSMKDLWK